MKNGITMAAADWWAERWQDEDSRAHFRLALLDTLPDGDWRTYSDYDPLGLLLEIVRKVKPDCRGCMFSSTGLLPTKTGLMRQGNVLLAKEGYGSPWVRVWPEMITKDAIRGELAKTGILKSPDQPSDELDFCIDAVLSYPERAHHPHIQCLSDAVAWVGWEFECQWDTTLDDWFKHFA